MADPAFAIRPATRADLPALGRLGAHLVDVHAAFDRRRFITPTGDVAGGYAAFLGSQLRNPDVLVLVAERDAVVVGYLFAGVEPFSWQELRDEAAFVHDIVVDETARRGGVARALMDAAAAWARRRGVASLMLWTAWPNAGAQQLFEQLGFRRTMVEMTLDL